MSFKDKYTTDKLIVDEKISMDLLTDLPKDVKLEEEKIVLSNDAFAIGEMMQELSDRLELLNNRMVR